MGCVIPHWKEFDKAKKCGSGFFSYGPDVLKGGGVGGGNYVSLVGDETINGFKTFAARTTFSSIFSNGGITGTNLVYNTGDQQIGGIKTFSDGINLNREKPLEK